MVLLNIVYFFLQTRVSKPFRVSNYSLGRM